jgi:hypothetical protein
MARACQGFLQARNVSCEIITKDYYEEFPLKYCIKAGHTQPLVIRSCNTNPCVEWQIGEWGEVHMNISFTAHNSLNRKEPALQVYNPLSKSTFDFLILRDFFLDNLTRRPICNGIPSLYQVIVRLSIPLVGQCNIRLVPGNREPCIPIFNLTFLNLLSWKKWASVDFIIGFSGPNF